MQCGLFSTNVFESVACAMCWCCSLLTFFSTSAGSCPNPRKCLSKSEYKMHKVRRVSPEAAHEIGESPSAPPRRDLPPSLRPASRRVACSVQPRWSEQHRIVTNNRPEYVHKHCTLHARPRADVAIGGHRRILCILCSDLDKVLRGVGQDSAGLENNVSRRKQRIRRRWSTTLHTACRVCRDMGNRAEWTMKRERHMI